MHELAGFGTIASAFSRDSSRLRAPGGGAPTASEIEKHAQLRPKVSERDLATLEHQFKAAYRDLQRVSEHRRRCGQYTGRRKPEDHGYSAGCAAEEATLSAASSLVESLKGKLDAMREEMGKQRQESYDVDMRKYDRSSEITYVKTATGLIVPVRNQAELPASAPVAEQAPAQAPRPAPRKRFPWLALGLAVSAAVFLAKR
jgi:hypothetical protein